MNKHCMKTLREDSRLNSTDNAHRFYTYRMTIINENGNGWGIIDVCVDLLSC